MIAQAENQNVEAIKATNSIGMVVVLTSFAMLFATLFLGYAIYRLTAATWPPTGMSQISLVMPSISTAVILLSSLFLWLFQISYRKGVISSLQLSLAIAFGLGFIRCQFALWDGLKQSGLFAGTNIFTSIIYAFTWIHVGHMVAAIFALFMLIPLVFKNQLNKPNLVENVSKFWHFLGIIWVLLYITIFVI